MSLPTHRSAGNPANPNSPLSPLNTRENIKTDHPTLADWLIGGFVVGLFALGILATLIQQHFS